MTPKPTDLRRGEMEAGTVNGREFVRIRYRADGVAGLPGGPGFGFVYAPLTPEGVIQVAGFGTQEATERLESAAQTIRGLE